MIFKRVLCCSYFKVLYFFLYVFNKVWKIKFEYYNL